MTCLHSYILLILTYLATPGCIPETYWRKNAQGGGILTKVSDFYTTCQCMTKCVNMGASGMTMSMDEDPEAAKCWCNIEWTDNKVLPSSKRKTMKFPCLQGFVSNITYFSLYPIHYPEL